MTARLRGNADGTIQITTDPSEYGNVLVASASGLLELAPGGVSVTDGDKGDITVSGTGTTWTIDNAVVTYAKIQSVTDVRLLGRSAGSAGPVQELTVGGGLSLSGGALTLTDRFPWVHSFGLPNFGGQTSFYMQTFTWVGAVLTAAYPTQTNSCVFFPKSGGVLNYIQASYVGSTAPAEIVTFTVEVDGVATSLAVPLAAAGFANGESIGAVVLPPASNNYRIEVHCTAPANPGSGAGQTPSRVTVGGYVIP